MKDFPTAQNIRDKFNNSDYNNNPDVIMEIVLDQILKSSNFGPKYNITTASVSRPTNKKTEQEVIRKLRDLGYRVWIDGVLRTLNFSWN